MRYCVRIGRLGINRWLRDARRGSDGQSKGKLFGVSERCVLTAKPRHVFVYIDLSRLMLNSLQQRAGWSVILAVCAIHDEIHGSVWIWIPIASFWVLIFAVTLKRHKHVCKNGQVLFLVNTKHHSIEIGH